MSKKPIIKESELFALCATLNTLTGNPQYDKAKQTVGTYRIGMAYGAYRVEQVKSSGGGVIPQGPNYGTKREVYDYLNRLISKMEG